MPSSVHSNAQETLVAVLVAARRKSGLLQAELGAIVGKDQSYVSNIERGQRRVDVLEFYQLARAMKADPVILFGALVSRLPEQITI
jgi:transcriptional regulator with XRE-family HTH domain